jgi:alkylhydroperoxidase family enzyme
VGSEAGLTREKILALDDYANAPAVNGNPLFDQRELAALEYADAITLSDQDVDDALFARLQTQFSSEAIIELTAVIAWENASSKFNRALRVASQNLYDADSGEGQSG